jgi:hypothetical protein
MLYYFVDLFTNLVAFSGHCRWPISPCRRFACQPTMMMRSFFQVCPVKCCITL